MATVGAIARPLLDEADHGQWRHLIEERCGLSFGASRTASLRRGLWQRMARLGLSRYGDYYLRVAARPSSDDEWLALLELLVNQETSFFRHAPTFEALRTDVLPSLIARRTPTSQRVLRLWSAGCASGPEAYSLALEAVETLAAVMVGRADWQVQVTGSDISRRALDEARIGIYRPTAVREIPGPLCDRYLKPAPGTKGDRWSVRESLRAVTRFEQWNAVAPETYPTTEQDVILCQNLLVYLQPATRADVVRALCRCLAPGGHLFLGPGEVVGLSIEGCERITLPSCLVYRRPC